MSYYLMSLSNHTAGGLCQTNEMIYQIGNLTASYSSKGGQELMVMVAAPAIMFILVGLFFGGIFSFSAILDPKFRLLLSSALAVFLLVMSYLFSEAKEKVQQAAGGGDGDLLLSVRARVILTWMLLVELLRKKVDEIRVRESYSSTIQRAGRVVWLGSLIYFNIRSPSQKAVFSVLWILCATKLVQRIVFAELEKRSCPDKSWIISSYMAQMLPAREEGEDDDEDRGRERVPVHTDVEEVDVVEDDDRGDPMKMCHYIVMGEEKITLEAAAGGGYKLKGLDINAAAITVGRVWRQLDEKKHGLPLARKDIMRIRRVCLSFALFKLLRRRFELGPVLTTQEADDCRNLILNGLYSSSSRREEESNDDGAGAAANHPEHQHQHQHQQFYYPYAQVDNNQQRIDPSAAAGANLSLLIFQVMADEVRFASEYYHSVVPVVLASPSFVLVNYFLLPVVVLGLCLIALAACGRGDLRRVLVADNYNYVLQPGPGPGLANTVKCALASAHHSRPAALFVVDLSVTLVLFAILFLEEIWELLVVLTSNWFMIATLWKWFTVPRRTRDIGGDRRSRRKRLLSGALGFALWLWRKMRTMSMHTTTIRPLKQLCLLDRSVPLFVNFLALMPSIPCLKLRTSAPATVDLKQCIVEYLVSRLREAHRVTEEPAAGGGSLPGLFAHYPHLLARASDDGIVAEPESVSEAILMWHITTCVMETERPPMRKQDAAAGVAMSLSRYCAYLLVFHPELLPDRRAKAELVLLQARGELLNMLGFWGYYMSLRRARVKMLLGSRASDGRGPLGTVRSEAVCNGIKLGGALIGRSADDTWKALADVWVQLIVYAAPSSDEEHANAHKDNLAGGVELITLLWAFATHTGMKRGDRRRRHDLDVS